MTTTAPAGARRRDDQTAATTVTAPGPTRSPWPLVPTLAVTWLAFGQVLSLSGLTIWVVGGSLLGALVTSALAGAGRRGLAVTAAVVLTLAVPFLAGRLGGDSAGPITRASLMATGVAVAMGLIRQTRYPGALVAAALIGLGGACGLGAAGLAPWLVGAWAVAAAATWAMLGPYTRPDLRAGRRLSRFALLLSGAGLAAVAVLGVAAPVLSTPWTIPGAASTDTTQDPADTSPDDTTPDTPPPPDQAEPTPPPPDQAEPTQAPEDEPDPVTDETVDATRAFVTAVALVLLLLLVLVGALFARRGYVAWRWRRVRRRLDQGDARRRIVGAWTWVRLRRAHHDEPLPVSASPDVAVRLATAAGDQPLREAARLTAAVAYDPDAEPTEADARLAWQAALAAGRPPEGAGLRQRWAWAMRGPADLEVSGRIRTHKA